jgi:hypothetical protein
MVERSLCMRGVRSSISRISIFDFFTEFDVELAATTFIHLLLATVSCEDQVVCFHSHGILQKIVCNRCKYEQLSYLKITTTLFSYTGIRGAMVARLTLDQKVACSIPVVFNPPNPCNFFYFIQKLLYILPFLLSLSYFRCS